MFDTSKEDKAKRINELFTSLKNALKSSSVPVEDLEGWMLEKGTYITYAAATIDDAEAAWRVIRAIASRSFPIELEEIFKPDPDDNCWWIIARLWRDEARPQECFSKFRK